MHADLLYSKCMHVNKCVTNRTERLIAIRYPVAS